jgi:probable HAF family extracellular repeat protein
VGVLRSWTWVTALNDSGVVTGSSSADSVGFNIFPFISFDGVIRQLPPLDIQLWGWGDAVNARGEIAGFITQSALSDEPRLMTWDVMSGVHAFPIPERGETYVTQMHVVDIDDQGSVLAWWGWGGEGANVPILSRGGIVQTLPHLTALRWTTPLDRNNHDQIIGTSAFWYTGPPNEVGDTLRNYIVFHPVIWENGAIRDLGVLGKIANCDRVITGGTARTNCAEGAALSINDHGDIVGWSEDSNLVKRPVLWRGAKMTDLGVRPSTPMIARAINNAGQVAGDGDGIAFVWQNGTAVEFSMGGSVIRVVGMNNRGEVAGTALNASGEQHAFVWINGELTDLMVPGSCATEAVAINERGDVLLRSTASCPYTGRQPEDFVTMSRLLTRGSVWKSSVGTR